MFVSQTMTRKVITVTRETPLLEAQALMHEHKIRHLPVIDADNRLKGIITDRDVRSALPYHLATGPGDPQEERKYAQLKVAEVMTADPMVLAPTHTLQDAILLIQDKRVGALPVVDQEGKLKGIMSVRDLLRAFVNVLGFGQPGTLLCLLVEEKVGQLKIIVDAVTEENVSFGSVLVARYWEKDKRAVFCYLLTNNVTRIKKKLKAIGFELLEPMEWYLDQLPRSG